VGAQQKSRRRRFFTAADKRKEKGHQRTGLDGRKACPRVLALVAGNIRIADGLWGDRTDHSIKQNLSQKGKKRWVPESYSATMARNRQGGPLPTQGGCEFKVRFLLGEGVVRIARLGPAWENSPNHGKVLPHQPEKGRGERQI